MFLISVPRPFAIAFPDHLVFINPPDLSHEIRRSEVTSRCEDLEFTHPWPMWHKVAGRFYSLQYLFITARKIQRDIECYATHATHAT
jgi:hypothetical protein